MKGDNNSFPEWYCYRIDGRSRDIVEEILEEWLKNGGVLDLRYILAYRNNRYVTVDKGDGGDCQIDLSLDGLYDLETLEKNKGKE